MQESRTTVLRVAMAAALAALVFAAPLQGREASPQASPGPARRASQLPAPGTLALADEEAVPVHYRRLRRQPASASCDGGPPAKRVTVESTAYALRGEMANGRPVHNGAVAMNCVPLGTRYRILEGPLAGRVVTVEDRIRRGSEFDIWVRTSAAARRYGRRTIDVQLVRAPR